MLPHLLSFVGQKLEFAEALFYRALGTPEFLIDNIEALQIGFPTGSVVFETSSDGESLVLRKGEVTEANLGEYGLLTRAPLTESPLFKELFNHELVKIQTVQDTNAVLLGIVLLFSGGALAVTNWGDDLKLWTEIPDSLIQSEKLRIADV